jgi:osmotically inducible protein OsmC
MPMMERTATATWRGDLPSGGGVVSAGSGVLTDSPITWRARTEAAEGKTSPEELVAAAHASCFAMALSHGLALSGHPAENIDVSAKVTLDRVGDAPTVTTSELSVTGTVPGIDQDAFVAAADDASKNCPISRALGGVNITVRATLM